MKFTVWEQEEPGSDWFVPICKSVSLEFAEWSVKPENRPQDYERVWTPELREAKP